MPPRRRQQFTQENVEQQLQQIHLLDPSSTSENLEQLGPIIKQIHTNRQQEAYLRAVKQLIDSKDAEIEQICADNYQEFIGSVSTLFTIKSYTTNLRDTITSLDQSVAQVGQGVVEKKRALLKSKKTVANLDEAIDTLQASLRVLDVVNRVGEMIEEGKYWSALRSLEDIESMPPTSLSQTPLFQHLLSSLPSLRSQIKDAVTATMKQWLLYIREISSEVGQLALEAMDNRTRRWRSRREKDPMLKLNRVGSAVESVTYEKIDHNILDNDRLKVDFTPLYQCIHIYTALDALDEIRKSYQADRKAQSDLIIQDTLPLSQLSPVTQEIVGFFIIETHVLNTTGTFRSERDVEELWDALLGRLSSAADRALSRETEADSYLRVKEGLIAFVMTLEAYSYSTASLHSFIIVLFERYVSLLEKQFAKRFESIISQDDCLPMFIENERDRDSVLDTVWLGNSEREQLLESPLPINFPWSSGFYLCCQDIRNFVHNFYQFLEGVSQHHRNIDDLLSKSLENLLTKHIAENMARRAEATSNLSQLAQIITNLEHFEVACAELERSLTTIRSSQRGGTIRVNASSAFSSALLRALARVNASITSKLDDFFGLSEYDWTPNSRVSSPSMYLYELINWLTTVVDTLVIKEEYKDQAYKSAVEYLADCLMEFLTGRSIPMLNENAIHNILVDVDFLEDEFKQAGRPQLLAAFAELRAIESLVLNNNVQQFLNPTIRQNNYAVIRAKRLQSMLEKLARFGGQSRDAPTRERGERRRKEVEAIGKIYPVETR
ncbi:uncharacterized protein PHACADRAFT_136668 [Phanerochaete carnosa HHB-10118-sp]|uniref:Exocyst complex component SEC15 n=1 Tax=Phanerochaete carnosa (strain HHB-10118-sp) TaxID=650164 RepID=K5W5P8_PHACS|nr:uncharacterized protein PHACADRAFT_136668 [Phanerochaete carnosa HHB-10118-sp]EKM59243.1 hypothetical protein PHACADRAFT_136668 [Phanerochaete carnosa HHB-10118-sp]